MGYVYGDLSGFNRTTFSTVHNFKNVELICKKNMVHGYSNDLIFCYDDDRNEGTLFFGNWNDGVANQ